MPENFFDFQQRVRQPRTRASTAAPPVDQAPITVAQLTRLIDKAIKGALPPTVLVRGEISNYKLHAASGNIYFTLKDTDACIDCVMFKSDGHGLKFNPADGMELIATGRVGVYPQRGRYQLYVNQLQPLGIGALELAFKQLHARLQAEGLFDAERKTTIPPYPIRIGLLTSTATAALQDMLKVLRRFPFLKISILHVPVQGDGAAEKIADGIDCLNRWKRVDVILLSRGGGSLEDLWEFNEECVARAICRSRIAIVTGIGHEIDVSIADLAADYHAHTPTEAAQIVTMQWRAAGPLLDTTSHRLSQLVRHHVESARHRLTAVQRHEFFRRPMDRINAMRQFLDDRQRQLIARSVRRLARAGQRLSTLAMRLLARHPAHRTALEKQRLHSLRGRLIYSMRSDLDRHHQRLANLSDRLISLAPEQVLRRGYSITTIKKSGAVLRQAGQIGPGVRIITRLAEGHVESTVADANQPELFE